MDIRANKIPLARRIRDLLFEIVETILLLPMTRATVVYHAPSIIPAVKPMMKISTQFDPVFTN